MKFEWNTGYEPHLKLVGLENFKVLYFLRAEFFEIFGRAILWRAVYPRVYPRIYPGTFWPRNYNIDN